MKQLVMQLWVQWERAGILRLRSCRLPSVFIRRPCPPSSPEELRNSWGALAPWELPQFIATANPSATFSPSSLFPVQPVIGRTCSRVFLSGARKVSPVAEHALVTVLSLPPRRSAMSLRSAREHVMLPSPQSRGLGLRI